MSNRRPDLIRLFALCSTLLGLLFLFNSCKQPTQKPEKGISQQLAKQRYHQLDSLRYEITLSIPDTLSESIEGETILRFNAKDTLDSLILDFEPADSHLTRVQLNQNATEYTTRNGHIIVNSPGSKILPGSHALTLYYRAGERPLNRDEEYMYSLFVPSRASQTFPGLDQPNLKGRFSLTLNIPPDWTALSNSPVDTILEKETQVQYRFKETPPLPTYLFSFAAGKFQIEETRREGRKLRMFHRETDSLKMARNREKIFDLHAQSLQWLEEYTDIPHPFEKFDFVLIPDFQYGGMEHPGAILYRASRLLLETSATQQEKLSQASLIAHETAHMWFGDLVTMEWFNDVWTKEVFANFMAAKIIHPSFPDLNHNQRFILDHFPPSYRIDRSRGTHPIRQELDNLNNASSLYGSLIYHKAPIVMKKLENMTGPEKMREGLQIYLDRYQWKNASWRDLITVLDSVSDLNVTHWSQVWVEEAGRPVISNRLIKDNDSATKLRVSQKDPLHKDRIWPQYVTVHIQGESDRQMHELFLDRREKTIDSLNVSQPVDYIHPNTTGMGYGLFKMDSLSLSYLLENLSEVESPEKRAVIWIDLWENFLEQRIAPETFMQFITRTLPAENNPMNTEQALKYLEKVYWRFSSDSLRQASSRPIEKLLWSQIQESDSSSMKSTYFKAYRNIATTDSALDKLYRIWSKELDLQGISFSTRDYTQMAAYLSIHAYRDTEEILNRQQERIENPDRLQRFEFLRDALSPDPDTRDLFFSRLKNPQNRAHEPWVIDAVRYLHHPVRQDHARKYLYPSLKMLKEIERTGDIFFPKNWLDATFSGHNKLEAALVAKSFLEVRESYPHFLKQKLLQSIDPLFRAVEMRENIPLSLKEPRSQ